MLREVFPTHGRHRLDMWRRASEARLIAFDWDAGIADLAAGLALASGVHDWTVYRVFPQSGFRLAELREIVREWKPHVAFNLLQEFSGEIINLLKKMPEHEGSNIMLANAVASCPWAIRVSSLEASR